jgi:ABC-type uncharacterized transport system permease subunit
MILSLSLIAALLYALTAWRASRLPTADALTQALLLPLALLAHGAALLLEIVHGRNLLIGLGEASSLFMWLSALMLWVFCLREPLQLLGLFQYPIAAVCALWPALFHDNGNAIPLADWKVGVHIVFSLFSAGLLTLASLQALATAVLDRVLHHPGNIALARRLPPLQTMERLLFQLIFVGFFLLSLTLLSGLLFIHDLFGQHLVHKTVLSIAAWLMFGVLLWGRRRYGWRGRTALRWALSGYALLVLAYFGSKLVLEQILGTHWS